ncbi:MAG: metallophosphoesterase [Bacteroidetes bacterium]|jgi:predicted phosphodiesterase|nr:metallophosphoesterase [Bacteroidota bacterium]MBT5529835.1 metallophosphoesterase [Cytophagia bacterium]MBT3799914.1 metallophosphoesterase [Bacteroidota bacterium]MBT4339072.1 metallophosphoesterase [Bacteroidota bacterium]MBT5990667.1 metallophosphoesterase [Bacteroidota bacterium]
MKLAILTDIHEDYEGLKFALRKIEKKKCDQIICLGDISGFSVPHYKHFSSRDAHRSLQLIRDYCEIIIVGNHDLNAIKRIPIITDQFHYPKNWFSMNYHEKKAISKDMVWLYDHDELSPLYTDDDIAFLSKLPEYHILEDKEHQILFSHYIFPNLTGSSKKFFDKMKDYDEHFSFMRDKECQFSFCGHAHIPGGQIQSKSKKLKRLKSQDSKNEMICIQCPPLVNTNRFGEFTIFDTESMKLEFLKI